MRGVETNVDTYYPPPESLGGWRYLLAPDEVQALAGMDTEKLERAAETQGYFYGGDSWGIVIIRHGYLVREFYTFNAITDSRWDIYSATKSFTGTAFGLLFEDSRQGLLPSDQRVDLDSPAYQFIPEGLPLSDLAKERITLRHLLTMTSGIPGEKSGIFGTTTATGVGPFEHALGLLPNRFGRWTKELSSEPGTHWDYCDPGVAHLSLAYAHIMGRELHEVLADRLLAPIGIESLSWDRLGGSGFIGPHTKAQSGIHMSARELARFGYLALHGGVWAGRQIIPRWWLDLATQTSQEHNPQYGYLWWVNTNGVHWPGLPRDAFAAQGFRSNRCYVIPSLDLVIARTGSGPTMWNESRLVDEVVAAICG